MPHPHAEPALALWLLDQAVAHGTVLAVLRSAGRLDRLAALAQALAEKAEVLVLPAWDVLPYDQAAPSAAVLGRRVRTLAALAQPAARPRLVLASADAVLQRVRPAGGWLDAALILAQGQALDPDALRSELAGRGYRWDERVDEPGDVALRGQVIDVFPAAAEFPVRLDIEDGRIAAIHHYDPLTLRSTDAIERITLDPALEFPLDPDDLADAEAALAALEQPDADLPAMPDLPPRLVPVFDYMPGAACYRDPEVAERWAASYQGAQDAFAASAKARRVTGAGAAPLPRPSRLYLTPEQADSGCASGNAAAIAPDDLPGTDVPAPRRLDTLLELARGFDGQVVIAAPDRSEAVAASLAKRGLADPRVVALDIATGWQAPGLLLLPVGGLLRAPAGSKLGIGTDDPRIGETVVHFEHGVARLAGLRQVGEEERIALEFADDAGLLIPAEELDRVWRYGGEGVASLDRLGGEAWQKRRAEIEAEVARSATALADAVAQRAQAEAPVLVPPQAAYAAIARRFPYPPSPDQRAAIHAVLADLAGGHRMDRLVCGDVGFGKTEVAIRAAAATALAGWQVAIAAPTTVLARQHLSVFRRRFAGTGIRVEGLIRGAASPEGRQIAAAVARGEVGIIVGTQGLARQRFARLGLAVIDEEQRFGEADKAALAGLARHLLVMTATPIPRTLQAALVGLRDVSVLATPPQRRQPTRTFVLPWDDVVVREALLREQRRGGQSFVVCPRIADVQAMQKRLGDLVPELNVLPAHGRMKPEALEVAVLAFADNRGEVLLATNIIEAGLDVPRANLILVTHADRFGLAQLHQLRGRVGRGSRRGTAYFLTEPGQRLTKATRTRLQTMETLTGLGAGAAISEADLDLRGAGDLFGAEQAGHVRAVGTELYQQLLLRAVAAQRGAAPSPPPPMLRTGLAGRIPEEYVPEPNLRLSLLRRLALLPDQDGLDALAEELDDRFGPAPTSVQRLLMLHRLRLVCQARGVGQVDAGDQACALTPVQADALDALAKQTGGAVRNGRVILPIAETDPEARIGVLLQALSD